ncbi:bile acid:sodium symporter family protein [Pseudomonas asiatica]|uniref:bile acid:sodium symporter family protein n=1 Tax=Pseudomonas asiatica TaxID=2219225 RepID=UPI0025AB249A|nr:bile acid:sodium symporter family protein [Pseudomonas asiatica]MDM9590478.1 bile acid:sodium symporter family protein [Pseudomonas asiatica]
MARSRFLPDNFTLTLVAVVAGATFLPARDQVAVAFDWITDIAIGLLFFLHGAKLSRQAIVAGAGHWRLHFLVFLCTFVLFPVLGLALKPVLLPLVGTELYMGFLYLCALPATVQSAIAFTSLARGNIPAAICSAAASSLIGIFITPVLVALLMGVHGDGGSTLEAIKKISMQLLVPFVAGQIARRWIGDWVGRNKAWLKFVDQGSILLVVYSAFSAAVIGGLWQQVPPVMLGWIVLGCCVLLALSLLITSLLGKWLGFSLEDRITILFCGSKKSLATGVPMAQVLFAGSTIGLLILPLMLFHQIQLMVCASVAQRYARRPEARVLEAEVVKEVPGCDTQESQAIKG